MVLVEGKTRPLLVFVDSGCNCMVTREGVAEDELISAKLQDGPLPIGVAGGNEVHASGLWACLLPLVDGSNQVVRTLSLPRVTADMPVINLGEIYQDF